MTKKVIYVTGCLGFIGSYFTRECLKLGWYVRGIDKITYASNIGLLDEFNKNKNFVFEKIDINDVSYTYDCDYFVNFAAETHVDNSISNSREFLHSNVNGIYHLLELFRELSYSRQPPIFLQVSTDEVLGDIKEGEHSEDDLLKPSNPYSATKAAGDQLIMAWARTYNLPYIIVRPTNNYGIGQNSEKLIPRACKYLSLGKKIPLHNQGLPYRNWLHAYDTSLAILKIIESNIKNQIYNISGGFEQQNITTVQKIINLFLNRDIKVNLSELEIKNYIDLNCVRSGQDVRYSLNDNKLRKLGWQPTKIFDEEIPLIVKYYKENFIW